MTKIAFALGILLCSGSAIQAKDKGLTTSCRLIEAAKGTALAAITAGNCYYLYNHGLENLKELNKICMKWKSKTKEERLEAFAYACVLGVVAWSLTKTSVSSYEAYKKALVTPKDDTVIITEVAQPRKK